MEYGLYVTVIGVIVAEFETRVLGARNWVI